MLMAISSILLKCRQVESSPSTKTQHSGIRTFTAPGETSIDFGDPSLKAPFLLQPGIGEFWPVFFSHIGIHCDLLICGEHPVEKDVVRIAISGQCLTFGKGFTTN